MYRTLIRPLVIEDAEISWRWRNDAEVWEQTGNSPDRFITFDIENEWIQRVLADDATKRFAITVDDVYVGNIQLTNITAKDAEFHVFIGEKEFWGKGIAKEATHQILTYAKEVLKLDVVYLYVRRSNVAAIKVYEKNSFVCESEDSNFLKMTCSLLNFTSPTV